MCPGFPRNSSLICYSLSAEGEITEITGKKERSVNDLL